MSTQRNEYVMIGADIGYQGDGQYEKYEKYMKEEVGKPFCLFDGMNGEYVVLGILIAVGNEHEGLVLTKIDRNKLETFFGDAIMFLESFGIEEDPELIAVTHYR